MVTNDQPLIIRHWGRVPFLETWQAMRTFTQNRTKTACDELWVLQHDPVYTLGQAADTSHLLQPNPDIPVVRCDRGGQITYHGPGQLIIYCLWDLQRLQMTVHALVKQLEESIIQSLRAWNLQGERLANAPGVYLQGRKLCSLGLRVKRGCCYHGLAINIDMDLSPFLAINPCGMADMQMTQLVDWGTAFSSSQANLFDSFKDTFISTLTPFFGYTPLQESKTYASIEDFVHDSV